MSQWIEVSWRTLAFMALTTTLMYAFMLVSVRIAGRRTLAQISAFDVLVTIALGTILSSTALSRTPALLQGVTAVLTLLALQLLIAAARRRWEWLQRLVDFSPKVVMSEGKADIGEMGRAQITHAELWSKLRQQGVFRKENVQLAIVEPTGAVSVVLRLEDLRGESLADLADRDGAGKASSGAQGQ